MTSPRSMPAFAAGLSLVTALTRAPFDLVEAEALGHVRGDALHGDAELAAAHLAVVHELGHDRLRHARGDREADADVAARGRQDLGVDAHELAGGVDEGAARVALVDGRVGLQEVLEAAVARRRWRGPWRSRCPWSRSGPRPGGCRRRARRRPPGWRRSRRREARAGPSRRSSSTARSLGGVACPRPSRRRCGGRPARPSPSPRPPPRGGW